MRRSRAARPSLVGTVARTAVIAGTATVVSNSVSGSMQNSAQQKAAAQQAQADAAQAQFDAAVHNAVAQQLSAQQPQLTDAGGAGAGGAGTDMIAQLKKLGELHQAGILSNEEFAAAKAKLLAG